jgi:Kef-type K+ transport system membrane component KefB
LFAGCVLIGLSVLLFLVIRSQGNRLVAPEITATTSLSSSGTGGNFDLTAHILSTLSAVIALGFILGRGLRFLGQPPVIGEVLAGILLGPSFLGLLSPEAMHYLIPGPETDPKEQVLTALKVIAELGVILYMFLVGLELNSEKLRLHARSAVAISNVSILVPFLLGAALALWIYPILSDRSVPFTSFALFMGVAMSITAFPVLARILTDLRMEKTDLGVTALSAAATGDVSAWCLLALVIGVAQSQVENAMLVLVYTAFFIGSMFVLVRPVLERFCNFLESKPLPGYAIPVIFVAILFSAGVTQIIGIHAVFGAFLLGVLIPHDSRLSREFSDKLTDIVTLVFLPAFFAVAGLSTRMDLIAGREYKLICLAIIVVAIAGKFGGTYLAARFTGRDRRTSAALGALMNTRGLMELIVLNIGLSMGVISPALYAMLVLMALVTTVITAPAVSLLIPKKPAKTRTV